MAALPGESGGAGAVPRGGADVLQGAVCADLLLHLNVLVCGHEENDYRVYRTKDSLNLK